MAAEMVFKDIGAVLGTIAGTLVVGSALIFRAWSRLKLEHQIGTTEEAALKTLAAAVENWKGLYDTAWAQVVKERELREAAENRATATMHELEELRAQVAELKREVQRLTVAVNRIPKE
jgi:beta-phosphoglucomutase-like phosphatase (HAD superfamily)